MIKQVVVLGVLVALAGCQSYAPMPLDPQAHHAEWASRSPDSESVREFAARLGQAPPQIGAEGLRLADAEIVALCFNPTLRQARARAAVAMANSEYAGLWDDPSVSFDLLRIVESVPEPWTIGGALSFTIPISGRLPAEKSLASAEYDLELRRVAQAEWDTVMTVRSTWAQWSAAQLQAELMRELIERVDSIVSVVDRLERAQSLSRLEGRLFRMESAGRRSDLLLLDAQADQLEYELKSLLGLMPDAPVKLLPQVASASAVEDIDGNMLEERNPELAALRAAYEVAEKNLLVEVRKQYPDLQIGPAYEWDDGQSKIGFGAGIPLPLLNANRQGIAVARAERDAARAAYEAAVEQLVSASMQRARHYHATASARQSIEHDLLPLAEAQIADERRIAELGELNVLLTLESIVRVHETKVRLIDARLAEAQAAFDLQALLGPEPIMDSEGGTP